MGYRIRLAWMKKKRINKALFLDRDGVVNADTGYVFKEEHIAFVPGIFDLCREANLKGYRIIIITNQAGIARGYYSEEKFMKLMYWMKERLQKEGCLIDDVLFCPYHKQGTIKRYRKDSYMRKPNPGMLYEGAIRNDVRLDKSILIGDQISDLMAGKRAKIGKVFWLSGDESTEKWQYCRFKSISEIRKVIWEG
uniref:D-glycero-alpha-D-manno-heptose-1,7-bisphosphate 7-phosphatase n=1 Tax=Cyanobium sp. TaxID=2164130 RepID=UPI0040482465